MSRSIIKSGNTFTKTDTLVIKGIAVILMICNHLYPILDWIYPENMYYSISVGSKTIAAYVGGYSKICVSMFAFLTGYGLYHSFLKSSLREMYKKAIPKISLFLISYGSIILLAYIPLLMLFGLYRFDPVELLLNLLGYKTTYCWIAWYVRFYLELMLTFPLWISVIRLTNKTNFKKYIYCILILLFWLCNIIASKFNLQLVAEYMTYMPIVLIGYIFSESNFFEALSERYKRCPNKIQVIISLACLGFCFVGRSCLKNVMGFDMDFLYAPVFIFGLWKFFENNELAHKVFGMLGEYSLELWFLHAVFFIRNPYFQKIAYWPKIDFLILLWVIILLLPFAILFNRIQKIISKRILTSYR